MPFNNTPCPECGCAEEDHHFGLDYDEWAAAFINDVDSPRDGVNPCGECCACPRDRYGN